MYTEMVRSENYRVGVGPEQTEIERLGRDRDRAFFWGGGELVGAGEMGEVCFRQ